MQENNFCFRCGERLEKDAKFCTKCGNKIVDNLAAEIFQQPINDAEPIIMQQPVNNPEPEFTRQPADVYGASVVQQPIYNQQFVGQQPINPQPMLPPVKTASWLLVIGTFLGAFIVLTLVCFVI